MPAAVAGNGFRCIPAIGQATIGAINGQSTALAGTSCAAPSCLHTYPRLNQADLFWVYDIRLIMCLSRELPDCL